MRQIIILLCDTTVILTWLAAYVGIAWLGIKNKSYGMPFWCIALNLSFEFLYAITGTLQQMSLAVAGNWLWASVDIVILYTYIRYGQNDFPEKYRKYRFHWIVLILASAALIHLGFFVQFNQQEAAQYSSFLQDIVISVLLLWWYITEKNMEAQSIWIAILKFIGNAVATAEIGGGIWQYNFLVLVLGLVFCCFDLLYIVLFIKDRRFT